MKTILKYLVPVFSLLILFGTAGCNNHQHAGKTTAEASEDIYTCSMHPQVHEHQPGKCPICGMQLIKKNPKPIAANDVELESLLRPANQGVMSSLALTSPVQKTVDMSIKSYGVIEYDTKAAGAVSARFSGRIEKLYIRYQYQPVTSGQKVMDIYSPEILTAEQNLLFLLKNDPDNASFIQAAKDKLLLMGMRQTELQQLVKTGKPFLQLGIYSSYTGHVHDLGMAHAEGQADKIYANEVVTGPLSLKEGMYVQKGQNLLMIMDHHRVWAALQVFPSDQSLVKLGSPVTIIPESDTMAVIKSQVDFIEPFFRAGNKTTTVRADFHNVNMFPIGSHVKAEIKVKTQNALWLPQTAVRSLGVNQVVFIKKSGGFIAHQIVTGIKSGGNIQIISGLSEKDSIIVNAAYIMDSESLIKTPSK